MNIFKSLFNKKSDLNVDYNKEESAPVIRQIKENDRPMYIDPNSVGCGFLLFPVEMSKVLKNASIHDALMTNQTDLWVAVRRYNPSIPAYPFMSNHDVEAQDAVSALKQMGEFPGYSIAISPMKLSPDGGRTFVRIFVGFNWKSVKQEIYVTIDQKILPK